eukprot:c15974_g1_i1 orf=2-205(-)
MTPQQAANCHKSSFQGTLIGGFALCQGGPHLQVRLAGIQVLPFAHICECNNKANTSQAIEKGALERVG